MRPHHPKRGTRAIRIPKSSRRSCCWRALLAHAYAHEDDDRFFGTVAASALGLALLHDSEVLAVGAAVAASLLAHVSGHERGPDFSHDGGMDRRGGNVLPDTIAAVLQPANLLRAVSRADPPRALAAAAAAACALIWASRRPRVSAASRTFLPIALIAVVTVGGIYALFFREPADAWRRTTRMPSASSRTCTSHPSRSCSRWQATPSWCGDRSGERRR